MWVPKLLVITIFLGLATAQPARPTTYRGHVQDFLDAHNVERAEVGVGPIYWNETLAAYARRYAKSRVGDCNLEHSNGPYGENIAEAYGEMYGGDAVRFWATEKKDYDYHSNTCHGEECRHYTQIVWKNSIRLGCAIAKCVNNWVFVTCNYDPPGNYIGERPY